MTDNTLWFHRSAFGAGIMAVIVIILGVATRLMDAGLGCPDWPGCYGKFIVPNAQEAALFSPQPLEPIKAWIEMIHRYVAGFLGIIATALVVMAYRYRTATPALMIPSLVTFIAVGVQGLFGMLTVTLKLWPVVVTLHLLGGILCLTLFCWLALISSKKRKEIRVAGKKSPLNLLYIFACVALVGQIALGGWTSSNYAGVGCIGFPQCNGEWWPDADFSQGFHLSQEIGPDYLYGQLEASARTGIHLVHRSGAIVLGLSLLLLWRQQRCSPAATKKFTSIALTLYIFQLVVAVALVHFSLPLSLALLHTSVAVALWVCLFVAGYQGMVRGTVRSDGVLNGSIKQKIQQKGVGYGV